MSVERTDLVKMGQHLVTLRKSKKMTQMKLAEILDVSNKTVSKWETGDIAPDITLLRPLADVLDVSVNELLAGYNTEDSDDVVSYYKKFSKKKLIKETSIFAIIIFAMVMLIAAVERYYMWNV
ncbi:MAG: helix-turn-helix transcriptional regulator, partial [Bacilli bacterium]|nr:helix-turn-helix transcriptional regulator [Bacilli bacterium]